MSHLFSNSKTEIELVWGDETQDIITERLPHKGDILMTSRLSDDVIARTDVMRHVTLFSAI